MSKSSLLFVFVIIHTAVFAQYDGGYAGGRQAALGGSSVNLKDGWSILNNTAGMGDTEKMSAGIFYKTQYSLNEFSLKGAAFQLPTDIGAFGLAFTYYGYNIYNEKRFVFGYGRHFMPMLRGGVGLEYLHTRIDDDFDEISSSKGVITFHAGLQADLSEKIELGFSVFNPWAAKLSEYEKENIPAIARLGLSYSPDENFLFLAEAEQNSEFGLRIKAGAEYKLHKKLIARGGFKTNPAEYTFGVGTEFLEIKFNVSVSYHLILGYSPHGDILYGFE
ncbi:MAG: hypothetical protein ACOCPM_03170 [Bacteroidales bacterium]